MRREGFIKRWKEWVMPLCFVFSSLINLAFYYLGLAFEDNLARQMGFILGCVLFAVIAGVLLLYTLQQEKISKWTWILLGLTLTYFIGAFTIGVLRYGINKQITESIQAFVVFGLPAFFAGVCTALLKTGATFFEKLERLSFFAVPSAVIYLNGAIFNCNPFNYGRNLGIIGYMSFAYTIMPFLLAHMIQFVRQKPLVQPVSGKAISQSQLLRGLFITIYWLALIASGTRGAYFCVAGFCALLVISRILHREPVKSALFSSVAMAAVLLFNLFIYSLPGFYAVGNMSMFFDGLKEGQIITSNEAPMVSERLDELVGAESGQQIANLPELPGEPEQHPEEPTIVEENLQIGNRGTLFKLAFMEFQKQPLLGMGACGYLIKYGQYPHNVILESLCETGLVGVIILLGLVVCAIIRMLSVGWRQMDVRMLLLFFAAYAIRANISGSLWGCAPLLCALGYGLALSAPEETIRQEGTGTIGEE